jgi:hypothetical protein
MTTIRCPAPSRTSGAAVGFSGHRTCTDGGQAEHRKADGTKRSSDRGAGDVPDAHGPRPPEDSEHDRAENDDAASQPRTAATMNHTNGGSIASEKPNQAALRIPMADGRPVATAPAAIPSQPIRRTPRDHPRSPPRSSRGSGRLARLDSLGPSDSSPSTIDNDNAAGPMNRCQALKGVTSLSNPQRLVTGTRLPEIQRTEWSTGPGAPTRAGPASRLGGATRPPRHVKGQRTREGTRSLQERPRHKASAAP